MKKILDELLYQQKWEKEKTYSYNSQEKKENTFVIDTPPPTISGSLHIGHVFSYTQTDIIARYLRMKGKNVFYPMGWDNNGLPTEKRVQNLYKVNCDPTLTNDSSKLDDLLKRKGKKKFLFLSISRKNFMKVCSQQTQEDQKQYEQLWRRLALSVDWHQTYETISSHSQMISQRSFLDLYQKGFVENRYTPIFWDTQFKTAVAQADIEDRPVSGFFYDIPFQVKDRLQVKDCHPRENGDLEKKSVDSRLRGNDDPLGNDSFVISTTRPELLPACIAVAAHPEDERYKKFFHKEAITPLFSAPVPILPSTHADPEKGTGILMICSFGDMEDARFWEKHKLPLKQIINAKGFLNSIEFKLSDGSSTMDSCLRGNDVFMSLNPDKANQYYLQLKGLRVGEARKKIVEILKENNYLKSEPKPKKQSVKFYEKGDFPLEIIPTWQWYVKILDFKKELLEQGQKINWHPPSMLKRYEQWVEGLNQDWCISRQRFFGVPFPVWYPLDKNKTPNYNKPLLPDSLDVFLKNKTSVDPMSSTPADWNTQLKEYTEDQRGKTFIADTAVMDTWATSSLTPQISSHWGLNEDRHKNLFPADLRPQAHEIIRTWAFYTIVKSFFHENSVLDPHLRGDDGSCGNDGTNGGGNLPWKNIAISGWVMNPQRLKLSKSKGAKIISPMELIEEYSADAIRYWAGKVRLGVDTVYDENIFKIGRKLTVKLNNAFQFVQIQIKGQKDFASKLFGVEESSSPQEQSSSPQEQSSSLQEQSSSLQEQSSSPQEQSSSPQEQSSSPRRRGSTSLDSYFHGNDSLLAPATFPGFSKSLSYISTEIDQAWIMYLLNTHRQVSAHLDKYHYSQALELIEKSFWLFCDNYLELIKGRSYQFTHFAESEENLQKIKKAQSAVCTLDLSIYLFIKMMAPYIPYMTEHIWAQRYKKERTTDSGDNTSIHTSSWHLPKSASLFLKDKKSFDSKNLLDFSFNLLEQIRNQKASQKKSLSTPIKELKLKIRETDKKLFDLCREDIARSSHVQPENIVLTKALKEEPLEVLITLS